MINKNTLDSLEEFRIKLLSIVLMITAIVSLMVTAFSLANLLFLDKLSQYSLIIFGIINIISYFVLINNNKYYFLLMNISTFGSLFIFALLAIMVLHDEFRLVWFLFTIFASFIFAGKKYGIFIAIVSIFIILPISYYYDIHLSTQALFTFVNSIVIFSVFVYFFIEKIENAEKMLFVTIEQEVQKQREQESILLRQYRMANMGEMIDAIAHQWRQPLNQSNMIIMGMEESLDDKEYIQKNLTELTDLNSHMSQTIDDFRHLLSEDKEKRVFSVNDAIEKVFSLLKNNLRNINIAYDKPTVDINIIGYKNELVQVLIILLHNAVEALIQNEIKDKHLKIEVENRNDSLYLHLSDNAKGIDESLIDKIFDPYFTTKKEQNGTGLGLYIAKIIVEQNMNGKLSAKNHKDGVKFTIVLNKNGGDTA